MASRTNLKIWVIFFIKSVVDELLNFLGIDKYDYREAGGDEITLEIDLIGGKYPEYFEEMCEKESSCGYYDSKEFF